MGSAATHPGKGWQCPNCRRTFRNRNQFHSCVESSLGEHFEKHPPGHRDLFEHLVKTLEEETEVQVEAVKNAINLGNEKMHYAMVYVQKSGLKVEFTLKRHLEGSRILRAEAIAPETVVHQVRLKRNTDIDGELLLWLKEARGEA